MNLLQKSSDLFQSFDTVLLKVKKGLFYKTSFASSVSKTSKRLILIAAAYLIK